jgi:DNA-binding transcriptional LysR family regulator
MESQDRQLRYFVRIAETKSLSRAADDLDLTQSAISRQLASLEAYVGNALFARTGRGVELTECGRRLLAAAKPAYAAIDEALEDIRDKEGLSRGTIRVATVHTLSYYFTADVLAKFVGRHEQVNISLMGRSSPDVVALVESGRSDLGFVYDVAVNSADLVVAPLFDDEMCLIAPETHGLSAPVDLNETNLKLVGFPPHYALHKMLRAAVRKPQVVAEAETVDAMLQLVASGVGACVLPSRIPDRVIAEHDLVKIPIASPVLKRRIVAITRKDRAPSPLVQELLQLAIAAAS